MTRTSKQHVAQPPLSGSKHQPHGKHLASTETSGWGQALRAPHPAGFAWTCFFHCKLENIGLRETLKPRTSCISYLSRKLGMVWGKGGGTIGKVPSCCVILRRSPQRRRGHLGAMTPAKKQQHKTLGRALVNLLGP